MTLQEKVGYLMNKEVVVETIGGECYEGILADVGKEYIELTIFNYDDTKVTFFSIIPYTAIITLSVRPETLGISDERKL